MHFVQGSGGGGGGSLRQFLSSTYFTEGVNCLFQRKLKGGGVQMLIPIETYSTCDFHRRPGGGDVGVWGSGLLIYPLYLPMSCKELNHGTL